MKATRRHRTDDDGFTLVEMLIVVIVLGILATVTVLAVRGITEKGADSTCVTDRRMLETAVDAYTAVHSGAVSEQVLVQAGFLRDTSDNFDIAPGGAVVPQPAGMYHCA
jgi:prepilin-type N-terminal cleavage/methylation domain-containing protein